MPIRDSGEWQGAQILWIRQHTAFGNQVSYARIDCTTDRGSVGVQAGDGLGIGHQHNALGGQQALWLQREFKCRMTEHLHRNTHAPGRSLAPEQTKPIVLIPQRDEVWITAQDDRTALIKMGHRALRTSPLARPDMDDIGTLRHIEGMFDARITQPDQGVQQVMPVVRAGSQLPAQDAFLVVQTISEQIHRLRRETRSLDTVELRDLETQAVEFIDRRPALTSPGQIKLPEPIHQGLAFKHPWIGRFDGRDDKAQGFTPEARLNSGPTRGGRE